jgi:FkbM family methyltransferase
MFGLLDQGKSLIKGMPRAYDLCKRWWRRLAPQDDAAYDFFREFSRVRGGRVSFIQIGANDGLRNDPLREHIVAAPWTGVLVEPLPSVFAQLKSNYRYVSGGRLTFVNAAISDRVGSLALYTFEDDFLATQPLERRLSYLRKSSFDRSHVERFVESEHVPFITSVEVPVVTIASLMQDHLPRRDVDLLVIDAEGHEATIIESIDFSEFRPDAIFFESHNLADRSDGVFALLSQEGYSIQALDGDSLATRVG